MKKLIKRRLSVVYIAMLSLGLTACSSFDVSYIERKDLKDDPKFLEVKSNTRELGKYGAIKLKEADKEDGESRLFLLDKKDGAYMAETMVTKGLSSKYFFSFGLDYRNRTPRVGFRVEF